MSEQSIAKYQESFQDVILGMREYAGEITLEVKPESIKAVAQTLRDQFGFEIISDISAVDYYTEEFRFGLTYNLISFKNRERVRISVRIADEDKPTVDSVTEVWEGAMWLEREAFDMMGIRFNGHPDMRRMFMPEDFEYYPLRKEFPLIGIPGSIQTPDPAPPKEY